MKKLFSQETHFSLSGSRVEMDDEEVVLLSAALCLVNENPIKKRRRRYWVKKLYMEREKKGAYNNMLEELGLTDRENYFR